MWEARIDRLKADLELEGIEVVLFGRLGKEIQGRLWYPGELGPESPPKIMLDCPKARDACLTLLHEAGHWDAWTQRGPAAMGREDLAVEYGWARATRMGWGDISEEDWIAWHP